MKRRNKKSSKLRKLFRNRRERGSATTAREVPAETSRAPEEEFQPGSDEHTRFLAELGTGLWRLRQRMVQPSAGDASDHMRRAYRQFESVWDVLTQAGVEVQDHTGAPFDPGMSLKVIAFQPTVGIDRERVTETIRPSVYYNGESIQMGEVIVATPERDQTKRLKDYSEAEDANKRVLGETERRA